MVNEGEEQQKKSTGAKHAVYLAKGGCFCCNKSSDSHEAEWQVPNLETALELFQIKSSRSFGPNKEVWPIRARVLRLNVRSCASGWYGPHSSSSPMFHSLSGGSDIWLLFYCDFSLRRPLFMEQAKREPPVALHIQPASDQGLTELDQSRSKRRNHEVEEEIFRYDSKVRTRLKGKGSFVKGSVRQGRCDREKKETCKDSSETPKSHSMASPRRQKHEISSWTKFSPWQKTLVDGGGGTTWGRRRDSSILGPGFLAQNKKCAREEATGSQVASVAI
ncbi:hypothetical protein RUM44_006364 [Polyplax serrata]|uniref:Uncharacterized protein n=1 Tax=Polyplax serrata TaxID=468196 RepID=A0ABR1AHW0_POLSC